ncbi:MAG: MBL fold metallo-hydrolase RNA specificity domain-containing protein [Ignavibacteriales bacterium]
MTSSIINEVLNIEFRGAAKEVTGSLFIVRARTESGKVTFAVDCGMYQKNGNQQKNYQINYNKLSQEDLNELDFILLTHAHLDHSGLIPHIFKRGYNKPVYATKETIELCRIILADSGHIQEEEAKYTNKKNQRKGFAPVSPLYTAEDAIECMTIFKPVNCKKAFSLMDGTIQIVFKDSAHILGSAYIEVAIRKPDGDEAVMVFSGDIGNKITSRFNKHPNILIMESTYGASLHQAIEMESRNLDLARIILDTIKKGGKVLIPAFTVGRLQLLIFALNQALRFLPPEDRKLLLSVPIIIDSPMGSAVTRVFREMFETNPGRFKYILGEHMDYYLSNHINPFSLPNIRVTESHQESQDLNEIDSPMIIIAGSGMCNAGRIRHHLKHNLWKPENTVVFVGYQAQGTLGRRILSGEISVKINDEQIAVLARIENIPEFSAHADQQGLLRFARKTKSPPDFTFLVHGELKSLTALSEELEKANYKVIIPDPGARYSVTKDFEISDDPEKTIVEIHNPIVSDIASNSFDALYFLAKLESFINTIKSSDQQIAVLSDTDMEIISKSLHDVFSSNAKLKASFNSLKKRVKKGKR